MDKNASVRRAYGNVWGPIALFTIVLISVAIFVTSASSQAPSSPSAVSVERAIATPKIEETASKERTEAVESVGAMSPNAIVVSTYPFTATSGVPLENMSTGTTQLIGADQEDTPSAVTNIGFDFWFDGVRFTQFSCNPNGLFRFGPVAVSIAFDNQTGFETTTDAPKVAPYFDDLATGTNGKVHYKTIGVAPNRKLVVEWLNVQIPHVGTGNPGAGTFQMWLFETTGVVEFVYGPGVVLNNGTGGYTIGLQSGASSNMASVTSSTATVSYVSPPNTSQTDPIVAGTAYLFTPNIPANPTGLNFTGTGAVTTTLNWTDNSSNEVGFVISRSTDGGATYNILTQTGANVTSFTDNTVVPTTTYFYQVRAVTEGALSSPITSSVTTNPVGNVSSTAAGGNWSLNSTWAGGVVPTASDNVTIANGATVTIDTAAQAYSLTVGTGGSPAVLQFESANARSLNIGTDVTIATNGTFQSSTTGTITAHALSVVGNITNNGILDFSTNANTAGAGITFTGAANNSFGGTGAITDVRSITVNKGTSSASTLELNPTNLTVQGVATDFAGYLTLTNGTFKISGSFPLVNRTFTTPTYTIPATAGIWLNNPNYTVAGTASGATTSNNGLLRVSQGTYNVGVGAGDQMRGATGAVFTIEGGTLNTSGTFDPQGAVMYTQTGGTVNVAIIGNNLTSLGSFDLLSFGSFFTMSGGTINIINPSTGGTKVDYHVNSADANTNISGGTVVIGAGAAPASSIYNVAGQMPNTIVNATQTMRVNNAIVSMRGTSVTNNGIIDFTGTNPRYDFASSIGAMTYGGSGLFGTAAVPVGGFGISSNSGFSITLNSSIFCNRVNLFQGGFVNSNRITLGSGGTSQTLVQIGGGTTPGGNFDVSPIHNQGTGGQILRYDFETAARSTGVEINPTRVLTSINSINNPNNVTITGGDLTLTSSATALVLSDGRLITGTNNLILSSPTASVSRTNGYVDGNFRKNYSGTASKVFQVGTANGYSPVTVNVTGGTPADVTVKAVQGPQPNIFSSALALQRYWKLTAPATVTADLTFQYLLSDVSGNEAIYQVLKYNGTFSTPPGSSVDTVNHRGLAPGQLAFTADWTVGQPNAPTAAPATISGQITTAQGLALGGVTVDLNGYQSRRTITDGNGNYRFDNVETDHFYTVTPTLTNYIFSPGNRAFSLLGTHSDATFTATATQTGNPVTSGDFFVRQQYLDFLGREPDNEGWLYWTGQISACGANQQCIRQRRIEVSAAFFDSEEFQQTGSFVYGLYKNGLGRQLSYAEFSADRAQLLAGPDTEINKQAFTNAFVQRAEFLQKYQGAYTAEAFVDALLANIWQVTGIDLTANRETLIAHYATGGSDVNRSRSLVLRDVVDNALVRQAQYNPSFVLMEYFGYLRRDPDSDGYSYWLDLLNNREAGNYRGMVCAFITSEEYQRRFSAVVSYSNRDCG